jgi:hypothetical protein
MNQEGWTATDGPGGTCPVQAVITVTEGGWEGYFRARGESATLELWPPGLAWPNGLPDEDPYWSAEWEVGDPYDAGFITVDEATALINEGVAKFLECEKAKAQLEAR